MTKLPNRKIIFNFILYISFFVGLFFQLSNSVIATDSATVETFINNQLTSTVNQAESFSRVLKYQNSNTTSDVVLKYSLDQNEVLNTNSISVPRDWKLWYSTDNGLNFSQTIPVSRVTDFEARGNAQTVGDAQNPVKIDSSLITIPKPSPIPVLGTSTGGDGYIPIIYEDPVDKSKSKICQAYHHDSGGHGIDGARINCQSLDGIIQIPGYPRRISDVIPHPGIAWNFVSARDNDHVLIGSKLYLSVVSSISEQGLVCFDLATDSPCINSFIKLSEPYADLGGPYNSSITGVYKFANYLYSANNAVGGVGGVKPRVYCYDIVANNYCDGFTIEGKIIPFAGGVSVITAMIFNDNLIITDSGGVDNNVMCYKIITGGDIVACNNYPLDNAGINTNPSHYLDSSGNIIGFCLLNFIGGLPAECFDFEGNTLPILPFMLPENFTWSGSSAALGTSVFYPSFYGWTYCWDFSLTNLSPQGGYCKGFKDFGDATHPPIEGLRRWQYMNQDDPNSGNVPKAYDYGYVIHGDCVYGLGDHATLWTFNPVSGNYPCTLNFKIVSKEINSEINCSTAILPKITKWLKLAPKNGIYPTGITSVKASFYTDSNYTNLIPGYIDKLIPTSGFDLSGIDPNLFQKLWVKITANGQYENDFDMELTFETDMIKTYEICFQSASIDMCDITSLTSTFYYPTNLNKSVLTNIINSTSCVGTLGDFVWFDQNENGIQDQEEFGIANENIDLYDRSDNFIKSAITNEIGKYLFTDIPSNIEYYIKYTPNERYTLTALNHQLKEVNSDIDTISYKSTPTLVKNGIQDVDSADVGLIYSALGIGNFVWNDINKNGIQDSEEIGISGVILELYDENKKLISSTSSDYNGKYYFYNIEPLKTYFIFVKPIDKTYIPSPKLIGNAKTDSDLNSNFWTDPINLEIGKTTYDIDFALHQNNTPLANTGQSIVVYYLFASIMLLLYLELVKIHPKFTYKC